MKRRTGKRLSQDDESVWRQIASTVQPLHKSISRKHLPETNSQTKARKKKSLAAVSTRNPVRLQQSVSPVLEPHPKPSPPNIDRRIYERMRRGKLEPEARLDLHGMTLERAHTALLGFINSSHARGLRLVLVITGKGREANDVFRSRGVLRSSLPGWLEAGAMAVRVQDIRSAHRRHGGDGAFYIYLRRRRD